MSKAYAVAPPGTGMGWHARRVACWLITGLLLGGTSLPAHGAPSVEAILRFKPRQEGVNYSTPAADQLKDCKVELVKGHGKGSGWLLKDGSGRALRRFFDTNDDNRIDVWSYFKDGVEVYSEIDTGFAGSPDQFRWLNAGGSKWGVDEDRDGRIDRWKVISPEEIGQEILHALLAKDFKRVQTLMITEEEMRALDLPAAEVVRIRARQKDAAQQFEKTLAKLPKLSAKSTFLHLETEAPQCLPADQTGSRFDLVKHAHATVVIDSEGASEWVQTGEILRVGATWRVTGAPVQGPTAEVDDAKTGTGLEGPEAEKLVQLLTNLDKSMPSSDAGPGPSPALAEHHLSRADLLEKIVGVVKADARDPWIRQVADSLSTAAQKSKSDDNRAMRRLLNLERQITEAMPGSNLAAYVTFREIQADYYARTASSGGAKNANKLQEDYLARLAKFVDGYPKAEDTPDALLQLGMTSEILNKDVEARNWYGQLARNFADKPQAAKAAGAARRLQMEGKVMSLAGPLLGDSNIAFDLDSLRGKVVIVYYWASWNDQAAGEFAKLKSIVSAHGGKVELVCVNLDNKAVEAREFLGRTPVAATHLHQDGGLESKLATDYGIMVLPSTMLVGKDGKVISRSAQVGTLEEEIKKQLK